MTRFRIGLRESSKDASDFVPPLKFDEERSEPSPNLDQGA